MSAAKRPLTSIQRGKLFHLMGRAHTILTNNYAIDEPATPWRKREMVRAGCPDSMRDCTHVHFSPLKAHFLALVGEDEAAFDAALQNPAGADEGEHNRRAALHTLEAACRERGLQFPNYPGAIFWRQQQRPLEKATAQELKHLLFTVCRNRKPDGREARKD